MGIKTPVSFALKSIIPNAPIPIIALKSNRLNGLLSKKVKIKIKRVKIMETINKNFS